MKRIFASVVCVCLAWGCCPGRRGLSPAVSDSLRVEREVRYVERLRDTVVYVEVPAESREVRVQADSSFLETSLARSAARVGADGTLSHTLEHKPQRQPVGVTVRERSERERLASGQVQVRYTSITCISHIPWVLPAFFLSAKYLGQFRFQ